MGLYSGLVEDLRLNVRFLVLHLLLGVVSLFVAFNFGINIVDALITIGIISFLEFLGILISIIAMLLMTTGTKQPDPVLLNIVFPSINRKVSDAISIALGLFLMISAIQWWLPVNKDITGEGGISLSSPPDILVLEVSFGFIIAGMGIALIIGALFKLTHWPGANLMLTVGLVTEAVIFFFSAFEPLHEELDWTLVYPQLAGLDGEFELPEEKENLPTSSSDALAKFNNMIDPIISGCLDCIVRTSVVNN